MEPLGRSPHHQPRPRGSDDGFNYFRSWLIAQGRVVYEKSLEDPETLAEVEVGDDGNAWCEHIEFAAGYAYEDKTGETDLLEEYWPDPDAPVGEPWEEADMGGLYPRLCARYVLAPVEAREP